MGTGYNRRITRLLPVLSVLFVFSWVARAGEPLAVARLKWEAGLLGSAKASKVTLAANPPKGITPPTGLQQGSFGSVTVGGDKRLAFALGAKHLWLDLNLNSNLADDRPLAAKQGLAWRHTPSVRLGKDLTVDLTFYRTATCKPGHIHYYPGMHRRGSVLLEGRVRLVGLSDGNADLKFDDPQTDLLYIDLDGDGRLGTNDTVPRGAFLLRGVPYAARIGKDGAFVEFRKAAKGPDKAPSRWTQTSLPKPSTPKARTDASLEDLSARFEREKKLSYTQRYATLRDIAGVRNDKSFRFLDKVGKDRAEHVSVRREAVLLMGNEAYKVHIGRIARIAEYEPNTTVQEYAFYALYWLKYEKLNQLARRVLGASPSRGAAVCLVLQNDRSLVVATVTHGASGSARYVAYLALRYGKEPPPFDLLVAAASDNYAPLRGAAIRDLAALGLPAARTHAMAAVGAKPMPSTLAYAIVEVLGRAGDAGAVRALLRMAGDATPKVLERLRKELGPIRDPAVTAEYLRALNARDPKVRALAARLLGPLPGKKTTDALLKKAKREKDPTALQQVLEALGEHKDPRAVSVLLSAARSRDEVLRVAAIRALARIGPGVPRVHKFFMKLLTSKNWQNRVYALDAAREAEDASVGGKVIVSLQHKVWQVRHAAAEALVVLRLRSAVAPMIKLLQIEDVKRVRAAVANALFKTTGQNLYDFVETWTSWWAEHGRTFEVPAKVPQRKPHKAGGSVASFYGLPLDSGRIIFVVDQSGSMNATDSSTGKSRFQAAVIETLAAVGRLKGRDSVNVILFESMIRAWRKKLTPLTKANRAALTKHLRKQNPMGGTNLYDGLELALADKNVDTIFLLSDGVPTGGKYVSTPNILRAVGKRNQTRRIAIHCVSVGTDSDLLRKLAAANGGKYVRR